MTPNDNSILASLYDSIPDTSSTCEKCSDCCGVVPFVETEASNAEAWTGKRPHLNGISCGYLSDHKCTIYEIRPFMCRLMGAADIIQCEKKRKNGCNPPLTREQASHLVKMYRQVGGPMVFPTLDDFIQAAKT